VHGKPVCLRYPGPLATVHSIGIVSRTTGRRTRGTGICEGGLETIVRRWASAHQSQPGRDGPLCISQSQILQGKPQPSPPLKYPPPRVRTRTLFSKCCKNRASLALYPRANQLRPPKPPRSLPVPLLADHRPSNMAGVYVICK
jgi:hypothetical protein